MEKLKYKKQINYNKRIGLFQFIYCLKIRNKNRTSLNKENFFIEPYLNNLIELAWNKRTYIIVMYRVLSYFIKNNLIIEAVLCVILEIKYTKADIKLLIYCYSRILVMHGMSKKEVDFFVFFINQKILK